MSTNLEDNEEEQSVNQNTPDNNVGQNASSQAVGIDHDSSVPVNGNKGPGQWRRDDWDVDETWVSRVSEIERRQIEEVNHENEFCPDKVRTGEEHNESECKKVVNNKVASNSCSCVDRVRVGGEQVPDIADLEDEQEDPKIAESVLSGFMIKLRHVPVDRSDH